MYKIIYKRGWIKKLREYWIKQKIVNLDLSGIPIGKAQEYAEKYCGKDAFMAFNMRPFVCTDGNPHTRAEIFYTDDEDEKKDYDFDLTRDFNKVVEAVKEALKKYNHVTVSIGYETHDCISKVEVGQVEIKIVKEGYEGKSEEV